ncbi:allophanate hydrolase subunit 1 [Methylosinus sp. RM1]|uniref:5-oxoprolinase subunit B family protein n=1 Tax=Methylosinus sp. RM1 TaxID=2583817 RepID=UPI00140E0B1A|nr:allophanate hydrolase subunit 1 [Methylosinus sp. RM1]
MRYAAPRCLDAGEAALVVEFGDSVDPAINAEALALDAALRAAPLAGIVETVPTYRSLMIHYDPLALTRAALVAHVEALERAAPARAAASVRWIIPCCYAPPHGEDIAAAGEALSLSPSQVAALHAGADYRAYMYGFAPGWCYLGGLPSALAVPRRASPRGPTPRGAVLIGGGLSLIGADPMPTGWYVLGRTPERMFAPERDPSFFVEVGDALRFEPIDEATFRALEQKSARGEMIARRETMA